MWLPIQLLFVAFSFRVTDGELPKDYNGYRIYGANIKESRRNDILSDFFGSEGFEFIQSTKNNYTHIIVSPKLQRKFERKLQSKQIPFKIIEDDLGETVSEEYNQRIRAARRSLDSGPYDFTYFPRYSEIIDFMKHLVLNRKYSQIISIGMTSLKKEIYAMKVQKSKKNPVFIIDAGIHAREWASHVTALYIMKKIVKAEENLAAKMTFIIIPCLNPDGYEYSHTNDRFWRKSRSDLNSSKCIGVDLNRNFDVHWSEFLGEKEKCGETYAGPKPFSEPETIALRNLILMHNTFAYITFHSFGAYIMYPYAFKKDLPCNWQILHQIALKGAQSVYPASNYVIGSSARVLYRASGGSDDWAMEKGSVPIVYTIELPEVNGLFFILPVEKIKPLVQESYKVFIAMVDDIYNEYEK